MLSSTLVASAFDRAEIELLSWGSGGGVVLVEGGATDASTYHRLAERLNAGGVYVNGGFQINSHTPFGGVGISGFGKEGGKAGIDEFLHYKTVTIGVGAPIFPK